MGESKFAKIATVKDLSYTDTAVSPSTPYITVYRLFPPNGAAPLKAVMTKTSL